MSHFHSLWNNFNAFFDWFVVIVVVVVNYTFYMKLISIKKYHFQ